jgi:hypothetical protein
MLSSAAGFRLIAADGYHATITYNQMMETRYVYANHSINGSDGASAVEPVIAWEWGEDGSARPENLRFFIGQRGPMDVNTLAFVRHLNQIEVLVAPPGQWDAPGASIPGDSEVPFGTNLYLQHEFMDSIRIYYTLDGSDPDFNSLVYNRSTSFFQPHLIAPIFLTESVTVKAFAAGFGRDPSPVVTLSFIVE